MVDSLINYPQDNMLLQEALIYLDKIKSYVPSNNELIDELDLEILYNWGLLDRYRDSIGFNYKKSSLGEKLVYKFISGRWYVQENRPWFNEQPNGTLQDFFEREDDFKKRLFRLLQRRNGKESVSAPAPLVNDLSKVPADSILDDKDKQNKVQEYCLRLELSDGGKDPAIAIRYIGELYQSQVEHFRKRCLIELKRELQSEMIGWYNNGWCPNSPRLAISMIPYNELTDEQEADLDCYFSNEIINKLEIIREDCFNAVQIASEVTVPVVSDSPPVPADITSIRPYPQIFAQGDEVSPTFDDNGAAGMIVAGNTARAADGIERLINVVEKVVDRQDKSIELQQQTANSAASINAKTTGKITRLEDIPPYDPTNKNWVPVAEYSQRTGINNLDILRSRGIVSGDRNSGIHGNHIWRAVGEGKGKNGRKIYYYIQD